MAADLVRSIRSGGLADRPPERGDDRRHRLHRLHADHVLRDAELRRVRRFRARALGALGIDSAAC